MTAFFAKIVELVSAHPHFAHAAVFLLALSEAMPIIGTVIPGSTLILGISALAPRGFVELWPLLIAAIAGAIVGDGLSFWLGRRYHRQVLLCWPLNRYPQLVSSSEAFFRRYGSFSVFLARFTPAVRAFVPLVSGIFQLKTSRFYIANVLSALVWAPLHVFPGVLVGAIFSAAGAAAGRLAVLLILVPLAVCLAIWLARLVVRLGVPIIVTWQTQLRAWAGSAENLLTFPLRSLLDPRRNETKILGLLALVLGAAAWIAFSILETAGDLLLRTDAEVYYVFQNLRTYWGDAVMMAVTELGATMVAVPLAVVVLLWFAWRRAWRVGAYWIAAIGFAIIIDALIKMTLNLGPRSDELYLPWSDYSPMTGHSTVNAVMYVFLSFLLARRLRPGGRLRVALAATALVVLIALSRLYLGAHWFSEVAGGVVVGMAWVALLSFAYVSHESGRRQTRGLLLVVCGAFISFGSLNIYRTFAGDMERYGVRPEVPTMAAADWWATEWQQLPTRRIDIKGTTEEPLTLQWAGDLRILKDLLLAAGWHTPEPWSMTSGLGWLAGNTDPLTLPVMPYLDSGRAPSLVMIRPQEDPTLKARLVLRLWDSGFDLTNGVAHTLCSGSVVAEYLTRYMGLFTVPRTDPNMDAPRDVLAAHLSSKRFVARSAKLPENTWDGRIVLAYDAGVAVK